jgi:hypothetical protein
MLHVHIITFLIFFSVLTHSEAILFELPLTLDGIELDNKIQYRGGEDVAVVVAKFLKSNAITPNQEMVNALNNRLIEELRARATDVDGKQELFRVPFKIKNEILEMVVYDKTPVLLLASNFCVSNVKMLDQEEISVAQCCETVIQMTDDLHNKILSSLKNNDAL